MALNFKIAALGVAVIGVALGVAFGVGVAYGRGDPKTVESGLTAQQIQSMLGISGAQAAGAQGTQGQGTTGGQRPTGTQGGALGGGTTVGRVTAISGSTVTIQTAQGTQRINLATGTSISKITTGAIADLKEGQTIMATGSRKDDGSFDAAGVTQLPSELQALFGGGANPAPSGTQTP